MLDSIRWVRVLVGGLGSELGVVAALMVAIAVYRWMIAPGLSPDAYRGIGERVGYYVAPTAGFVTTLGMAIWATRGMASGAVLNGVLVGIVSVAISLPFFFSAKPEHRLMYGIAFALRLAAGGLAGLLGHG